MFDDLNSKRPLWNALVYDLTQVLSDDGAWIRSLSDADLEALVQTFQRSHPEQSAVIEQMTDAELEALVEMSPSAAEAFVRARMRSAGEF